MKFKVACLQTNAQPDISENLRNIEPMLRQAREQGADLIALPENVALMLADKNAALQLAVSEDKHPAVDFFRKSAKELGVWLLVGSIAVATQEKLLANRSLLIDPQGQIVARYDKIHLFDVVLSEHEFYKESATVRAGASAVLADVPWGKMGLTICYDVRFPHLYRALAKAGADILTIPAAFTETTGKMHWHVLVRARAIETGCFVLAPAQCGTHDAGRRTYGHSLIVAPNGEILAEGDGENTGIILAELDMSAVAKWRKSLPSLQHDREFRFE